MMNGMADPTALEDFQTTVMPYVEPRWCIAVTPERQPDDGFTVYGFDSVQINPFNGGDKDEIVITRWDAMITGHREIASFRTKPQLIDFRTSELHIEATDADGDTVYLRITPATCLEYQAWLEEYKPDKMGMVATRKPAVM